MGRHVGRQCPGTVVVQRIMDERFAADRKEKEEQLASPKAARGQKTDFWKLRASSLARKEKAAAKDDEWGEPSSSEEEASSDEEESSEESSRVTE